MAVGCELAMETSIGQILSPIHSLECSTVFSTKTSVSMSFGDLVCISYNISHERVGHCISMAAAMGRQYLISFLSKVSKR